MLIVIYNRAGRKECGIQLKKIWKKSRKTVLLIGIAMVAATMIELLLQVCVLQEYADGNSQMNYNVTDMACSGLEVQEGRLVSTGASGEIHIYPDGAYVDKLVYSYQNPDTSKTVDLTITVVTYDVYGNSISKTIQDKNPYVLDRSVVNVRAKATDIRISIPEGMEGLEISDIQVKNIPRFHGLRWLFFATLLALILLIWANRYYFSGKVEKLFLMIGLTTGTMLVLIMPLNKVGFDEEAHFRNAYNIKLSSQVSSTKAIEHLKTVTLDNWPYNIAQSIEEREAMEAYYKTAGDYSGGSSARIDVPTELMTVAAFDYIFMAAGIKIGKLLQLPFTAVYTLGRLFNMWSYVVLVYFGIKRLPIGKYIMAVLALMPTPMFLAAVYSYDAIITGCMFLGISYLIHELIEKEKKITVKNGMIMLGSLGFGILPKAIYFPVMLLPFLIPKDKFKNTKQRRIFRTANVVCVLGLIAAILISMLFAGAANDTRGGDVNAMEQVALILSHPLGYAKVWLENVKNTFWSYGFGIGSLGVLGHLEATTCASMIGLLLIFTIATDNIDRSEKDLTVKQKVAFFLAAVLSVAFVWGTLYLSFNTVGATVINGVQGRYFIPLLFIFYFLLRRKAIKNTMNPVYYHYIVFGCVLYILYKTFYDCILLPYCF